MQQSGLLPGYLTTAPPPESRSMLEVQPALTFDDVLLVPVTPRCFPATPSSPRGLPARIALNIPFVSSAMDTVTEARLAIGIAQAGGIGIIHKNMTAEEQARQVRTVKKFESGVIADPITVSPRTSIRAVIDSDPRARHLRGAGGRWQRARRHRDPPRPALRDPVRRAGVERDDPEGEARHGVRGRLLGQDPPAPAQAPHREGAGGERPLRAARAGDRQGHPEGSRVPGRLQGRARATPG